MLNDSVNSAPIRQRMEFTLRSHPALGRPVRVLAVIDRFDTHEPTPCAYIRMIEPLLQAARAQKISFAFVEPELVSRYDADLVLLQRDAIGSIERAEEVIAHCRRHRIGLIYDLDDNFFALGEMQPKNNKIRRQSAIVLRLVSAADEVWVSSRRIKSYLQHANSQIQVIENFIDTRLWRPEAVKLPEVRTGGKRRILYMGTPTHREDLQMILPALRRLKEVHGEGLDVCFMGAMPAEDDLPWMTRVHLPESAYLYPVLCAWLATQQHFDIGIAPLRPNEFNRCKSDVKYLDYSAMGLATVASDLEPYCESIQHDVNGLLVDGDSGVWFKILDGLLRDDVRLLRLRKNALAFSQSEERTLHVLRLREARMLEMVARQRRRMSAQRGPCVLPQVLSSRGDSELRLNWARLLDVHARGVGVRVHCSAPRGSDPKWAGVIRQRLPVRLTGFAAWEIRPASSQDVGVFYGEALWAQLSEMNWAALSRPLTRWGRIILACPVGQLGACQDGQAQGQTQTELREVAVEIAAMVTPAGLRPELVAEVEGVTAIVLMRVPY